MDTSTNLFDKYLTGITLVLLREKAGFSQDEMAQTTGMTRLTWAKIEQGTRPINIDELQIAVVKLGLTPNKFFEEMEKNSKQLTVILGKEIKKEGVTIDTDGFFKVLLLAGVGVLVSVLIKLLKKYSK